MQLKKVMEDNRENSSTGLPMCHTIRVGVALRPSIERDLQVNTFGSIYFSNFPDFQLSEASLTFW